MGGNAVNNNLSLSDKLLSDIFSCGKCDISVFDGCDIFASQMWYNLPLANCFGTPDGVGLYNCESYSVGAPIGRPFVKKTNIVGRDDLIPPIAECIRSNSSSKTAYQSFQFKHENSITLLLLLSPKNLTIFGDPLFSHRSIDTYSIFCLLYVWKSCDFQFVFDKSAGWGHPALRCWRPR